MARIDEQAVLRVYALCKMRGCPFDAVASNTVTKHITNHRRVIVRRMYKEGYPVSVIANALTIKKRLALDYIYTKGVEDMVVK